MSEVEFSLNNSPPCLTNRMCMNNELSENIKKFFQEEIDIAIVLGSGLGGFEDILENKKKISYKDIPDYPMSKVKGHKGTVSFGELSGKKIVVFSGRSHMYEGITMQETVINVLLANHMKAKKIIITNAAGGISYGTGAIVNITDHINMTGMNPLIGENNDMLGERFPDMSNIYKYSDLIQSKFSNVEKGVYLGVLGPSYETPAEVRMMKTMGADMVGMSTVLEAIMANYLGMEVIGFSLITNYASGMQRGQTLSHEEVTAIGKQKGAEFRELVKDLISFL